MYAATEFARQKYPGKPLLYLDSGNKFDLDKLKDMIDLINSGADMVLGNRVDTINAMRWHQKLGTKAVLFGLNTFHGTNFIDISPFRLVQSSVFDTVQIEPKKFRWTTEMLSKALATNHTIAEIDIVSKKRLGSSKISGTFINSLRAGGAMMSGLQFANYKGGNK